MLRKLVSLILILMVLIMTMNGIALAADDSATTVDKESLRPVHDTQMGIMSVSLDNNEIGNENIKAKVEPYDGRFNFGLSRTDDPGSWYNISYSWPSDPWSSETTIKIDDRYYDYGYDGYFVQTPHNTDNTTNEAVRRIGDVTVKQVVSAGHNPATGINTY